MHPRATPRARPRARGNGRAGAGSRPSHTATKRTRSQTRRRKQPSRARPSQHVTVANTAGRPTGVVFTHGDPNKPCRSKRSIDSGDSTASVGNTSASSPPRRPACSPRLHPTTAARSSAGLRLPGRRLGAGGNVAGTTPAAQLQQPGRLRRRGLVHLHVSDGKSKTRRPHAQSERRVGRCTAPRRAATAA